MRPYLNDVSQSVYQSVDNTYTPLKESVNLLTIVDFPVLGLPIIAIIGNKLAITGRL